jgi:ribosomal protein L11 methyltransferase
MQYVCITVDVDDAEADEAAARLFDLGSGGVEWRDATTLAGAAPGKVTLVASFGSATEARAAVRHLPRAWSPRLEEVAADAWRDEWKKYFEPFRIAPTIVVAPPWRPIAPTPAESVIILEPGRAFGTGLHETTSLVAELLFDYASCFRGLPVLDVGCGSGILSLVALALGAARVQAIDIDPEAVTVARENAQRNGKSDSLVADVSTLDEVGGLYAAVVANIEAPTLVTLSASLANRVGPGGVLVLSGLLAPDAAPRPLDEVRRAYAALREAEVRRKGDWVALVLRA